MQEEMDEELHML
jgi:hypothetical protein